MNAGSLVQITTEFGKTATDAESKIQGLHDTTEANQYNSEGKKVEAYQVSAPPV
jgi:hypothetical protein